MEERHWLLPAPGQAWAVLRLPRVGGPGPFLPLAQQLSQRVMGHSGPLFSEVKGGRPHLSPLLSEREKGGENVHQRGQGKGHHEKGYSSERPWERAAGLG